MTIEPDPQAAAQAEPATEADNQNPDTATPAEGTETPTSANEPEKQPQGKPWYLNRIHEEAEKRRRAEAELAAFRAQQQQPQAQQTFQSPEDIRAAVEMEVRNRELQSKAQATYKAGKEQFRDYDQAIQSLSALGDGVSNPDFLETVFDLENASAVLHALGSDPNQAAEILQMKPARMGRELEKLSAKLQSAPKQAQSPSKTAPVISPVGKSSGATTRQEDWGPAEWDKFYKERRR